MAIYSCNLASIGRTTHAAGTAGAHLRYIGRERAEPEILAAHMPRDPRHARTWMDNQERADRKNARVIDKIRVALPRELDAQQRAALVQEFARDLTGNRIPWYAALHQTGPDAHNPHAHIVVRDRDIETGKRVLRLSDSERDRKKAGLEPKAVEHVRQVWETSANRALERTGHTVRIDRRTLQAQGIDRQPTIHIGANANHIDRNVGPPQSRQRLDPTRNHPDRVIDYPAIDAGRTRRDYNAEIIDLNRARDLYSRDPKTRARAKFERDQTFEDRTLDREVVTASRRRTAEDRRVKRQFRSRAGQILDARETERAAAQRTIRDTYRPRLAALKERHHSQRQELRDRQSRLSAKIMAVIDFTGRTTQRRAEAWRYLRAEHRQERETLRAEIGHARTTQLAAVDARHQPAFDDLNREKRLKLSEMRERHAQERREEERRQQQRAAEREAAREQLEQALTRFGSRGRGQDQGRERSRDRNDPEP